MTTSSQIIIDSPVNTVEVQTTDNRITVVNEVYTTDVTITQPTTTVVQVASPGPQGPQGPQGVPGVNTQVTNNVNNRVLTATGGVTINAESGLTFNGSDLTVQGVVDANSVDTAILSTVNVNSDLIPVDAVYTQTIGNTNNFWNQVWTGTSDGSKKSMFFGEDLLNDPGKLYIRTDGSELTIRAQTGIKLEGNADIGTIFNNSTLTNIGTITTPSLISTNLAATNSASFGSGFTPTARVHISGASNSNLLRISSPTNTNILFVSGSGNVGIGTTTPQAQLHVTNSLLVGATSPYFGDISTIPIQLIAGASNNGIGMRADAIYMYPYGSTTSLHFGWNGNSAWRLINSNTSSFQIYNSTPTNAVLVNISSSGNVGIGNGFTNPAALLHISGTAASTSLFRVNSGSAIIQNNALQSNGSASVAFFTTTGNPTSNFDFDIGSVGTANGGSVRIAGQGTAYQLTSGGSITRTSTGNDEMFGMVMGGTSTTQVRQNPLRVEFNASQGGTAGYAVLRLNATHTTVGSGPKLLQTWEFAGTQRSVVNITGSIGVGITTPSASIHISSSLGLPPMLALTPHHPLPTTNVPTGSFMVSASVPPKPFFWDGTTWNALY